MSTAWLSPCRALVRKKQCAGLLRYRWDRRGILYVPPNLDWTGLDQTPVKVYKLACVIWVRNEIICAGHAGTPANVQKKAKKTQLSTTSFVVFKLWFPFGFFFFVFFKLLFPHRLYATNQIEIRSAGKRTTKSRRQMVFWLILYLV